MPPKKKSVSNGFMEFTYEWKSKYGKHLCLKDATAEAGKIWANMASNEKAQFNEKAKIHRLKFRNEKLTCTGTPFSIVEKEKHDIEQQDRDMKQNIESVIKKCRQSRSLENQKFYFIMVNYFSKSIDGGMYVPAEISVSQFTLKHGVCDKYHSFVNPGINIYGNTYEAQQHSETTHNLPLPPKAFGERNLGKLYNDILNFIREDDDSNYPPLYTKKESIPIVNAVFSFLKGDTSAQNANLDIYSIQYLFFVLKNATCGIGELPAPQSAFCTDAYFERDFFEYQTGIACDFHEKADKSNYCTLSCVIRWSYTFSEYMCNDIAISLIPGRHIPMGTEFESSKAPLSMFNDNESFLSMGTESSFISKAVAGRHGCYDDQKSYVSETLTNKDEFPSLKIPLAKNTCKKFKNVTITENDDEPAVNPWTTRSQKIPKEPDTSYFKVHGPASEKLGDLSEAEDYRSVSSYGRGRGKFKCSILGSYGRGRSFNS